MKAVGTVDDATTDEIIVTIEREVNNESDTQAAKPPIRYVQMIRGMIADRVAERLGSDAFTMGVVLIDHQDRLWWQPVRHYLGYLAELCGFPVVNPRRARAAVAALIKDGWLKRQRGQQGTHSQDTYEMMMKVELSPYQNGSDSQMTPNQSGIRHPTKVVSGTLPDRYQAPYQNGSANIPNTPNTPPDPNTPPPPSGEVIDSVESFKLEAVQKTGKPSSKKRVHPGDVERLYQAYPKKASPKDARRAIEKALKQIPAGELLPKIQAYATAVRDSGIELKYVPNPATWFNGGRWDDDPSTWPQKPTATQFGKGRPSLAGGPGQTYDPEASKRDPNYGKF